MAVSIWFYWEGKPGARSLLQRGRLPWDTPQRAVPSPRCSLAEPRPPPSIALWFEQLGLINHRNVLSLVISGECWFYGAGTLWSLISLPLIPKVALWRGGGAQCEVLRRDLARRLHRAHGHRGSCWPRFMPEGNSPVNHSSGHFSNSSFQSFVLCCQTRISC